MASPSHRRRARAAAVAVAILALAALAASAPAATAPAKSAAAGVHLTGSTALAKAQGATVLIDRGTVSGSPIGSGRITLAYTLHPPRASHRRGSRS